MKGRNSSTVRLPFVIVLYILIYILGILLESPRELVIGYSPIPTNMRCPEPTSRYSTGEVPLQWVESLQRKVWAAQNVQAKIVEAMMYVSNIRNGMERISGRDAKSSKAMHFVPKGKTHRPTFLS